MTITRYKFKFITSCTSCDGTYTSRDRDVCSFPFSRSSVNIPLSFCSMSSLTSAAKSFNDLVSPCFPSMRRLVTTTDIHSLTFMQLRSISVLHPFARAHPGTVYTGVSERGRDAYHKYAQKLKILERSLP